MVYFIHALHNIGFDKFPTIHKLADAAFLSNNQRKYINKQIHFDLMNNISQYYVLAAKKKLWFSIIINLYFISFKVINDISHQITGNELILKLDIRTEFLILPIEHLDGLCAYTQYTVQ